MIPHIRSVVLLLYYVPLVLTCSPKSIGWQSERLFLSETLSNNRVETGRSILLLPLINGNCFDTTEALQPPVLTSSLLYDQEHIKVLFKKDFEDSYLPRFSRALLDSFYSALFLNDVLALATMDSVWAGIPSYYMAVLRLTNGVRISSYDNIVKRKAVLEGELWNIKNAEVVWRAKATGSEMKKKISDTEFIAEGIKQLFLLMPDFIPVSDEENW